MNLNYEPIYYTANILMGISIFFTLVFIVVTITTYYDGKIKTKDFLPLFVVIICLITTTFISANAKWHMDNDNIKIEKTDNF